MNARQYRTHESVKASIRADPLFLPLWLASVALAHVCDTAEFIEPSGCDWRALGLFGDPEFGSTLAELEAALLGLPELDPATYRARCEAAIHALGVDLTTPSDR